jgi:uncharacterized protein (TIGR02246 family)
MSRSEDKLEILDLIGRYSHAADGDDPEKYADVFTPDGIFHGRAGQPDEIIVNGREAIKRFMVAALARRKNSQTRHHQSTTIFLEISETRALTRTYLMTTTCLKDQPEIQVGLTSIYEDEMVTTSAGWRIRYRKIYPDVKGILQDMRNKPIVKGSQSDGLQR